MKHQHQLHIDSSSREPQSHDSNCIPTHISSLPDDIILNILSKVDTKSAVAFSTQSRRWINLPLTLPNIILDDKFKRSDRSYREYSLDFGMFGLKQLILRNHLDKFIIKCHFQFTDSTIQSMIRAAVWKSVKEIHIFLGKNASNGRLPQEVLTSTTLVVLKLKGRIVFDVPEIVSLLNLKVFSSDGLILPDTDAMRRFFAGCSKSLEKLSLIGSLGHIEVVDITMQNLKKFTFRSYHDDMLDTKLSIDAPKLESFKYQGKPLELSFMKKHKFLAKVEIYIIAHEQDQEKVGNFINNFSGVTVKSLALSEHAIRAAYPSPLNTVLEYVTTLELAFFDYRVVFDILGIASQLKELIILSFAGSDTTASTRLFRWPDTVPLCLVEHIRRIEFFIFCDKRQDIQLIKYFLRHGKQLEMMVFSEPQGNAPNIAAFKQKVEGFYKCSECKFDLVGWTCK